ncbi:probable E3 ubiquitin-protein ligase HERC4 [Pseudoliparis swirei]|uniref:probable E3 ubiquitin-protein ligase HERC4 n=1 Tax=Pseudoliparis swirei TaxID=2059687 RepID=UPI0024BE6A54|nr:probable E3 ubiquitin-protein ligase HERC4 [Pseudoliparis swirei]
MFSWGENDRQGSRSRDGPNISPGGDGVHLFNLGHDVTDLSAGHCVLAFIKSNADAVAIMRTHEGTDGQRVRGKQKFVKCKEKIQAVVCGDDDDDDEVTLLSKGGTVLCVDTTAGTYIPKPLEAFSNIAVSQVACGSRHSVALTQGGQVYTWGRDSRGQLGLGRSGRRSDSPQHLLSLSALPLVQVAAGGDQSFALSISGGVFGWGGNNRGQLGLGDTTDRLTATPVCCLNAKKTIYISCGKDHTAILTKNGAVFTFGSGQYGQLGHNSFADELRPRLVVELWGAKVTKVACGRHHTLALTDSNRVYSFGCGEQGQLGRGEESHPSVPLAVRLPRDARNDLQIKNIYAGGNCSFATRTPIKKAHKESNAAGVGDVTGDVIDRWVSVCDSKSWKKIKREIRRTFSSASAVNQIFLDQSEDKHFQTSSKYSGLDLSAARHAFENLAKKDQVSAEVEAALLQMLSALDEMPMGVEGLRVFLLLNELLRAIQSKELAEAVATAVRRLCADSLHVLGDWWSSLPPSTMEEHVEVWKQALSQSLSSQSTVPCGPGVRNLLLVLQMMYNANHRVAGRQRISEQAFGLEFSPIFLQAELQHWCRMSSIELLVIFNFPFVMDLKSKKMAFDIYASYTKQKHLHNMGFLFGIPPSIQFFELKLKRASLLEGTFKQLAAAHPSDFKKQLVVYFDENPEVKHVFEKDLFHHLFGEMMTTASGMFMFNDSETLAWFPSTTTEEGKTNFFLLGVLCGLALYNHSLIHFPFPLALFKKLLGVEPTLDDLKEFSPAVGKRLQCILGYEEEELKDLDFEINWGGTDVDLDPQNPLKPLTVQNKKEFVDSYVRHALSASVVDVFGEFQRGFFQVCERTLVKLFLPEQLRGALVGQDVYDWPKLKQNTVWGPHFDDNTKQMFWEIFDELTEDQRKDFFLFVTGYRIVPILGMDQIQMKVQVPQVESGQHRHDELLPESLTCHSILYLPLYSSKELLRGRLTAALIKERGFSM